MHHCGEGSGLAEPMRVPQHHFADSHATRAGEAGGATAAFPYSSFSGGGSMLRRPCRMYTNADRLSNYRRLQKIGEGSYGRVYRCEDLETGETVALKQVDWSEQNDGVPSFAVREVSLLQDLQHPNTVRLLETIASGNKLFLVCEFFEKDLKKMLDQRSTPLVGPKLKTIMYQLLAGLHACHSRRIVHRDIKLANILVSKDESVVKLADFGLGKAFNLPLQTCTQEVMTLLYRAPEILLGERHYLPAVDMWSVGCVLAELALQTTLFSAECCWGMLTAVFQLLGTPDEDVWPGVSLLPYYNSEFPKMRPASLAATVPTLDEDGIDLLSRMLTYYPEKRLTAYQALQHRWFDEVRESCNAKLQIMLAKQEADQQLQCRRY